MFATNFFLIADHFMNKYCPLIGITLGGFQVFEKPTYIPLGKFTLLFGPNSSGKSAIQDAIDVVKILESAERLFSEPDGGLSESEGSQITQHFRVPVHHLEPKVEPPQIYVRKNSYLAIDRAVADAVGKNSLVNQEMSIPIEIENRWLNLAFLSEYELIIASEMIVQAYAGVLTINLKHPIFWNVLTTTNFEDVAAANPEMVIFSNGNFTVNGISGFNPLGIGFHKSPRDWLKLEYNSRSQNVSEAAQNLLKGALCEISCLVGYLMKATNEASRFHWDNVDASRRIPNPKELTIKLNSHRSDDDLFGIDPGGDERYQNLAASISSRIANPSDHTFSSGLTDKLPSALADSVNNALMNHLFIEKGYQIGFECAAYLSADDSRNALEGNEVKATDLHLLVRLHLVDAENRKLLLENVGTGIGYVLPVLCAAFDDSGDGSLVSPNEARFNPTIKGILDHPGYREGGLMSSGLTVSFIQQPELHLHPALQAALGDVFIEASGGQNQLIIETHSEHLLLRLLKRVRQTHQQVDIAPELRLKPEDLCVLYFDPQSNGTTKVRRLRVTREGDFMDRWPNGFFTERDEELF